MATDIAATTTTTPMMMTSVALTRHVGHELLHLLSALVDLVDEEVHFV